MFESTVSMYTEHDRSGTVCVSGDDYSISTNDFAVYLCDKSIIMLLDARAWFTLLPERESHLNGGSGGDMQGHPGIDGDCGKSLKT